MILYLNVFLPNTLIHVDAASGEALSGTLIANTTRRLLESFGTAHPITAAVIDNAIGFTEIEQMLALQSRPHAVAPYIASYLAPVNRAMQEWWAKQPQSANYFIEPLASDGFSTGQVVDRHFDQQFSADGNPQYGPLSATCTAAGEVTYFLDQHPFDVFDPDSRGTFKNQRSQLSRNPRPEEIRVSATPGTLVLIPTTTLHGAEASEGRVTEIDFSYLEPIR